MKDKIDEVLLRSSARRQNCLDRRSQVTYHSLVLYAIRPKRGNHQRPRAKAGEFYSDPF